MLMTRDSKAGDGPLPVLSAEVIAGVADTMMEGLRAKYGRAPTLAEAQEAMLELSALAFKMLHEEHGGVISSGAASVEGQHDDDDSA